MTAYIENLVETYNEFINNSDKSRPDFNTIKGDFSLYLEPGTSFEVIVIEADPFLIKTEPYQTNPIYLIFIRIQANKLKIIMDNEDTFRTLFPNATEINSQSVILPNLPFTYNGTVLRPDLILGIDAGLELTGEYMTTSYNTAQDVYLQDQKQVPTVSQTQTVTQTTVVSQQQITTAQNTVNPQTRNPLPFVLLIAVVASVIIMMIVLLKRRDRRSNEKDGRSHNLSS